MTGFSSDNAGYTDARLRAGMPAGWKRHPEQPHTAIVHDSGRLRITKAHVLNRDLYTTWIRDGKEWVRPKDPLVAIEEELKYAVKYAEELL